MIRRTLPLVCATLLIGGLFSATQAEAAPSDYAEALAAWQVQGLRPCVADITVPLESAAISGTAAQLATLDGQPALIWDQAVGEVSFTVEVPAGGLYQIQVEHVMREANSGIIERGLSINGQIPFAQAANFAFTKQFRDNQYPFARNSYGNDALPQPLPMETFTAQPLRDRAGLFAEPFLFAFQPGINTLTFHGLKGGLAIRSITLTAPAPRVPYAAYAAAGGAEASGVLTCVEAENLHLRSGKNIQTLSIAEPGVSPEAVGHQALNTVGGERWDTAGDWVEWEISVPADGLYQLAFDYRQSFNPSLPSFRRLEIDGQAPFAEMDTLAFAASSGWSQCVPGSSQTPYAFRLTAGTHTLRLTVVAAPYREAYTRLRTTNLALKALDLRVREIIGDGAADIYRLWNLADYLPTIAQDLSTYEAELVQVTELLGQIAGSGGELGNLSAAVSDLRKLAARPNDIAKSEDSLSAVYTSLSDWEDRLNNQPLLLDKLYVKSADQHFPAPGAGFFRSIWYGMRSFGSSFAASGQSSVANRPESVQVWVQRSRDYVDLMQRMADEYYTKATGIPVTVSYCPSGTQLLVLANASGHLPDVVTGTDIALPFELALRNTLVDLSTLEGFDELMAPIVPGSRIPYTLSGSEYAIAEEVRVNVLYYREDVLNRLGIPVPQTWDDITRALATLLQNNYNLFYPYGDYLTFFFQNNVPVYTPDGLRIAFDTEAGFEAFRYWTELFTKYGMQEEMGSFYQHFRLGDVPLGITGIDQYMLFDLAAPDISGLWHIAPAPGTYDAQGRLLRWQAGTQTGALLFKTTPERQDRAWDFMRWWLSTDTQALFADDLENYYGAEFRWFSANTDVVATQAWSEEAKAVLLSQLSWYKQQPMAPGGSYMTAREIWNAWNRTVLDKLNFREQLELTIEDITLEMGIKQRELGYLDQDGNVLKEAPIMTIDAPKGGEQP